MIGLLIIVIIMIAIVIMFPDHRGVIKLKQLLQFGWISTKIMGIVLKASFRVMIIVLKSIKEAYRSIVK